MELEIQHTNVFTRSLEALQSDCRFIVEQGGSRSSKTYSLCQLLIVYCLTNPGKMVSIVRKTFPTLRGTVMRDFFEVMRELDIYDEKLHHKTENIYNFSNGSCVEFFGADNEQKLRGRKRDILWLNEANELNFEEFTQLNMRTTDKLIFDFNPSDSFHWLYDLISRKESILIHSTYKDNPFLGESQVKEIENLINYDESYYRIYALGEKGTGKTTIYTHWKYYEDLPEVKETIYGLDFGFNHPMALIECSFLDNNVYVREIIYQSNMTSQDLISRMIELDISRKKEIICDGARPEIIEDIKRAGFNARVANKEVKNGIDSVKSSGLYIHKESLNTIKEISSYKWKTNGDIVLDEPVKLWDDSCFVGDTLITTDKGSIKIKDIEVGDKVLTSIGYKNVLKRWNNGRKIVKKYRIEFDTFYIYISSTPEHKIKTNVGWIEISKLQSGMMVTLDNHLMENYISYTQDIDTFQNTIQECTQSYGNFIMENNQRDITCTTSMRIPGIIELKTLNLLKQKNIYRNTQNKDSLIIQNGQKNFTKKELKVQKSGINQKKDYNGIENTQRNLILEHKNMVNQSVNFVKKNTQKKIYHKDSAITIVKQQIEEKEELIMKSEYVNVDVNSQLINIQKKKIVAVSVLESSEEEVYDLMIEDKHEYFANGILVHNCDAIRYAVHWYKKNGKNTGGKIYKFDI